MSQALEGLLQHPHLRQGGVERITERANLATGFPALDRRLPGGGWPLGALTEVILAQEGIGELGLVMPALARMSREGRWIVWVAPPHVPYAPALLAHGIELARVLTVTMGGGSEHLWAADQALRSGVCGAVLLWPSVVDDRNLRRLQLAAEAGKALGLLFRGGEAVARLSPAALRLRLESSPAGLAVTVLKCRGAMPGGPFLLEATDSRLRCVVGVSQEIERPITADGSAVAGEKW